MKKAFAVFIAIAIIGTFTIAQPIVSKYWQDVLRKPSQTWEQSYGSTMSEVAAVNVAMSELVAAIAKKDSDLAFNVRSLLESQEAMARRITALQVDVEALETTDKRVVAIEKVVKALTWDGVQIYFDPNQSVNVNDPNEVK